MDIDIKNFITKKILVSIAMIYYLLMVNLLPSFSFWLMQKFYYKVMTVIRLSILLLGILGGCNEKS